MVVHFASRDRKITTLEIMETVDVENGSDRLQYKGCQRLYDLI
jgi:hypothetical protein